jgi:hypothetical protein
MADREGLGVGREWWCGCMTAVLNERGVYVSCPRKCVGRSQSRLRRRANFEKVQWQFKNDYGDSGFARMTSGGGFDRLGIGNLVRQEPATIRRTNAGGCDCASQARPARTPDANDPPAPR